MTHSPGLFEVTRNIIRVKHYSIRTEEHTFTGSDHTRSIFHYKI